MDTNSAFDLDPEQLKELLALGAEATRFSPSEKPEPSAGAQAAARRLGTWIDRYKLMSLLGEGGMAFVYLAQQEYPLRRKVALKLIKPGMDTTRVIARFEAERQALALLHHPNIAQIFDAGTTEEGRPYFVMEYVKGQSITAYCDRHRLGIDRRLGLFQQVCHGIHHAHQRGIIHRDIKASNVLIDIEEDKAVPKIIDFGVARATRQQMAEHTLLTEDGNLVGTPEYMSPEQVNLGSEGIDVRSDVYSLGVLLYVLLTGALPFDAERLRQGGIATVRRIILEEDPKTPSTRLANLAQEASAIAGNRDTEVQLLTRCLRRELEWIPLKAMRKEREERYQSASELADDVQCYMEGGRLLAGPPSTVYRVRKFLRRHKALVAATFAVLGVSLIGTVVSVSLALGQARARSEAQAVSDFLLETVLSSLNRYELGGQAITLISILDATSEGLEDRFAEQPLAEAEIRSRLGMAYWSLGMYPPSEAHYGRAIEIYRAHLGARDPRTLACVKSLGWAYYYDSRYADAEKCFGEALQGMQRVLGAKDQNTLHTMASLGWVRYMQGHFTSAEELCRDAFETVERTLGEEDDQLVDFISMLASGYVLQGRYGEAEHLFNRGLTISRRELSDQHWATLTLKHCFGELYRALGRYNEAEGLLGEALEGRRDNWGQEHPDALWTGAALGWLRYDQGHFEEAEDTFCRMEKASRRVLGDIHLSRQWALYGLATVRLGRGQYDEAELLLRQVLANVRSLLGNDSPSALMVMNTQATLYTAQGRHGRAEQLLLATLEARRRVLGEEHPQTWETVSQFGVLRREQQRYDEAQSLLGQALDGRKRGLGPDHPACFESTHELAVLYAARGDYAKAERLLLEAHRDRKAKLGPEHPHTIESLKQLTWLDEFWNRPDEAEE